jgi:hypothetical protein
MKTFFVAYTVLKFGVPTIVNAHTSEFDLDTLEGILKFQENREKVYGEANIAIVFIKEVKGW